MYTQMVLSPAEVAFRAELRDFFRQHVDPGWRGRHASLAELAAYLRQWDLTLHAAGWGAPAWPREFGGRDATAIERAIFAEELARFDAPEGLGFLGKRLVAPILMRHGSPQHKRHIGAILSGEEVWCQGFSEPDAGSDLPSLRTRARLEGDEWVVSGRKVWTTYAQFADWILLLVRTGEPASRERGISVLLVDMASPGISVRPITTMTGSSEFNEITLDEVRVPARNMVGELDRGWPMVREVLQAERGADHCSARLVDIRRSLEATARCAGRIPERPDRHEERLGRQYARVFAIQLMTTDYLVRQQKEQIPAGLESVLKLYTTEVWRHLGDEQALLWGEALVDSGGHQQVEDFYQSRHYTISAGTSEIQRNQIASQMLRMPSGRSAP